MSALSVVAKVPSLLQKLFVTRDVKRGKYVIGLYNNEGEWQEVVIDDRIPCDASGKPAFGRNKEDNEMWVVLLEKAIAKMLGGYGALHFGFVEKGFTILTGGRAETLPVDNSSMDARVWKTQLWETLVEFNRTNVLMGCSKAQNKMGLVAAHAYGILDVRETKDRRFKLLKLRNPWVCSMNQFNDFTVSLL